MLLNGNICEMNEDIIKLTKTGIVLNSTKSTETMPITEKQWHTINSWISSTQIISQLSEKLLQTLENILFDSQTTPIETEDYFWGMQIW